MRLSGIFLGFFFLIGGAFAQNPVPFINQPLVPTSAAPGGPGFSLTINGGGFVSGSVVKWNGNPRTTTFISNTQLKASILQSDIGVAATATVSVSSPTPGGGTSNFVYFPIMNPSTSVSLNESSISVQVAGNGPIVADFNNDGNPDLVIVTTYTTAFVSVLLGNGDGTFQPHVDYALPAGVFAGSVAVADFNGDGILDIGVGLIYTGSGGLGILLGNGDGTFQPIVVYPISVQTSLIVAGDFNGDGHYDVILGQGGSMIYVLLGNGDGTFQNPLPEQVLSYLGMAVTDVNHDGKLDLLLPSYSQIGVMPGNGDGTFGPASTYATGGTSYGVSAADFSGDGIVDLAVGNILQNGTKTYIAMLLGNGNGFRQNVNYATDGFATAVADMNGDGILDLITNGGNSQFASLSILFGNGNGTFKPKQDYAGGNGSIAVADFNRDGRLDLAIVSGTNISVLLQDNGTVVGLSPSRLVFPTQLVGTVSHYKLVTLNNNGNQVLNITNLTIDSPDFAEISDCGNSVPAGGACHIAVFYTPTVTGVESGYLGIVDDGGGSPQTVALSGVGTIVSLVPTTLNFGSHPVGSYSIKSVILTNEGNGSLSITGIAVTGADKQDFFEIDACGNHLAAGAKCTIQVVFHPSVTGSRNAVLQVSDDGGGSPQNVSLTGSGT